MDMTKEETTDIQPVTRTKAQAKANYDGMSRWYDWIAGSSERQFRDQGLKLFHAQPDENLLELGCGTGHALLSLAQAVGEGGHVKGIDIAPGMVEITNQRIQAAGLSNVTLLCDDATTYQSEQTLDGVFMSFFLELVDTPEIPILLANVQKSLKENGRLVIVNLAQENTRTVRLYEWFHDHFPTLVDCRPIFVESFLQDAGFVISETKRMYMWGLPVDITLAVKPKKANSLAF